jgi:hypothetical protein
MGFFGFGKKKAQPDPVVEIRAAANLVLDGVKGYKSKRLGKKGLDQLCKKAVSEIIQALERL